MEVGQEIEGYHAYVMEVNQMTSPLASSTVGDFHLVYNGSANPDVTELIVQSIGMEAVKAGYSYALKVQALYINGPTANSSMTTIQACN
jgi:hypothetical protein